MINGFILTAFAVVKLKTPSEDYNFLDGPTVAEYT